MPLYFAYGSNMGINQMTARCPQSLRRGPAQLINYRWLIASDGYASVEPSAGDVVEGVLYEVTDSDIVALDHFEEVHKGCYSKHILPLMQQDTALLALVYRNKAGGTGIPDTEYLGRLQTAMLDGGISTAYIERYFSPYILGDI